MTDMEMLIYTMMAFGMLIGITIGFIYFNIFRWVQIKRNITKKNYGIIYFMSRGRALYPKIVNFGNDIIRTHKGLWVLYEGAIYRQISKEESQQSENVEPSIFEEQPIEMSIGEKKGRFGLFHKSHMKIKVKLHKKITSQDIEYRQGIPIMFLDIEDMIPLRLMSEKMEIQFTRNPYMIEAVLGKEIAAAELEALKMVKKTMKLLLIAAIIAAIIGACISLLTYFDLQKVGSMVYNLTTMMGALQ